VKPCSRWCGNMFAVRLRGRRGGQLPCVPALCSHNEWLRRWTKERAKKETVGIPMRIIRYAGEQKTPNCCLPWFDHQRAASVEVRGEVLVGGERNAWERLVRINEIQTASRRQRKSLVMDSAAECVGTMRCRLCPGNWDGRRHGVLGQIGEMGRLGISSIF